MSKLKIEMLNDQRACFLIQKLFLSLKIARVYYNELSIFRFKNCTKNKTHYLFMKETLMKKSLGLMNISKIVQEIF